MSVKDMFYPDDANFSDAEDRAMARERLVYNVTEDLLVFMEDIGVSKKELARRLGKSQSYVTQVLSGRRNMTLGSLSDICFALGFEAKIEIPVLKEKNETIKVSVEDWITFDSTQTKDDVGSLKTTSNIININRKDQEHWTRAA